MKARLFNITCILAILFFCYSTYITNVTITVAGASMYPTLWDGDILDINPSYQEIHTGDIVIIKRDGNCYVKRVIAKPFDKISIIGDSIYINDVWTESMRGISPNMDVRQDYPIRLGENEYFVMGDNRTNSWDSRSISFGNVSKEEIDAVVTGNRSREE